MSRFVISFLMVFIVFGFAWAEELPGNATVTQVIDGDTIVVNLAATGQLVHVRIVGIDAPEMARNGKPEQPGAEAARKRLGELVGGKSVYLTYDGFSNREDRYGRQLCYVSIDGIDVGLQLIKDGLARVMPRYAFQRFQIYNETVKKAP